MSLPADSNSVPGPYLNAAESKCRANTAESREKHGERDGRVHVLGRVKIPVSEYIPNGTGRVTAGGMKNRISRCLFAKELCLKFVILNINQ
ncbi:hypothetical protein NDU88_006446 [Pleurodeles waltl]|uniref:Uncharacterized protein n=1 Tax=Pleurodeles waltl TaxID=8319 RepID=A0AAV7U067_PLEWA|nr:hypothetical protein NDU88_006446 [Pleurodeles waltl]